MAMAMAAVVGMSSSQTFWADFSSRPPFMHASVCRASLSIASDCRARTESGSIDRLTTAASDTVSRMPATTSTMMERSG